jgi:hypothetical protein
MMEKKELNQNNLDPRTRHPMVRDPNIHKK